MFKSFRSGRTPKIDLAKMTKSISLDTLWITLRQTVSRHPPERAFSDPHVGKQVNDDKNMTLGEVDEEKMKKMSIKQVK